MPPATKGKDSSS